MSPATLSFAAILAISVSSVLAQQSTFPATPLASKRFAYPTGIPYQADTDTNLIRGTQSGYNLCNSTTENQQSMCQTSFLNSADDFCLWAPSKPDSVIADTEGEEVAWCTKPGRGTRLIPAGALHGIQFIKTPDYVQIVGFIDQTKINIKAGDYGGELDPHGADLRGNPMGGLFYSNAFSGDKNNFQQVVEWTNFMGGDAFCIKACDPAGPNAAHFCEHIYDRIGCKYNMPNQAQNGTFESCMGESQDYPGIYTENGQVMTFKQPGETEVPNPTYTPRMPASSSCSTFASETLFAALATVTPAGGASAAPSGSSTPSGSGKGAAAPSQSGVKGAANKPNGSGSAAGPAQTGNGAMAMTISGVSIFSVIFSALFLS